MSALNLPTFHFPVGGGGGLGTLDQVWGILAFMNTKSSHSKETNDVLYNSGGISFVYASYVDWRIGVYQNVTPVYISCGSSSEHIDI